MSWSEEARSQTREVPLIDEETERLLSYAPDFTDSFNCTHIQGAPPGKSIKVLLRSSKDAAAPRTWGILTRTKDGKTYNYFVRKFNKEKIDLGGGNWHEFLALIDEEKASMPQ